MSANIIGRYLQKIDIGDACKYLFLAGLCAQPKMMIQEGTHTCTLMYDIIMHDNTMGVWEFLHFANPNHHTSQKPGGIPK